jgi:RNA-binding protein 8A
MTDAVVDFDDSGDELELEEREAEHDDRTTQNYSGKSGSGGGGGGGGEGGGGGGGSGGARGGKTKGRGFATKTEQQSRYAGKAGNFDSVSGTGKGSGPVKSVEGWIVFATGIHEEAQEEDVLDQFREYGEVLTIDVNIDRRTGYLKGYAMVEFSKFEEAENAIKAAASGSLKVMGKAVNCSWCFSKGPVRQVPRQQR